MEFTRTDLLHQIIAIRALHQKSESKPARDCYQGLIDELITDFTTWRDENEAEKANLKALESSEEGN